MVCEDGLFACRGCLRVGVVCVWVLFARWCCWRVGVVCACGVFACGRWVSGVVLCWGCCGGRGDGLLVVVVVWRGGRTDRTGSLAWHGVWTCTRQAGSRNKG